MILITMVYTVLFLMAIVLIYYIKKSIVNIGMIFFVTWTVAPIIANIGLIGLYKPNIITNYYIFSSMIMYLLFYVVFSTNDNQKNGTASLPNQHITIQKHVRIHSFLNIISYFIMIPFLLKAINLIRFNGIDYLRGIATSNSDLLINSTSMHIIISWFIMSLYIYNIIIFTIEYSVFNQVNKRLLLFSIIGMILSGFTFAARAIVVKFLMFLIFSMILLTKNEKNRLFNDKFVFYVISIVLLLIIIIFTKYRSLSDQNITNNIILYYAGSISLLDYYIMHPEHSLLSCEYFTYGSAAFGFIYNIIPSTLYVILDIPYFGSDHLITQITSVTLNVGSNVRLNAIPTTIYYFLRDFGFIGLIVGFSMMGTISAFLEKNARKLNNPRLMCIYILFVYSIFKSIQNYEFLFVQNFFVIIYIWIFSKNSTGDKNNIIVKREV